MNESPLIWIVTGVSGSGKTVIGRLLAQKLECDFLEGDRRHPLSNIHKMLEKQPLDDEDRRPWLLELDRDLQWAIERHRETVITCSALKAAYRKQLTVLGRVQLVWLNVPKLELKRRLKVRPDHFMTEEMLDSQLAAFEAISADEQIVTIDLSNPLTPDEIISKLAQEFPSINTPWWQRCAE
jgi:gluconokinase